MTKKWYHSKLNVALLIAVAFLVITLFMQHGNNINNPVKVTVIENTTEEVYEEVVYQEDIEIEEELDSIQWESMPVKYFIVNKKKCGGYESRKIKRAFDEIEEATGGVVSFKEVFNNNTSNIDISCSFIENCYEKWVDIDWDAGYSYTYEQICEHTLGIARTTEYKGNFIKKAEIEMIGLAGFVETTNRGTSGFYVGNCGHATTELHEILHTFGYDHVDDLESIMYYTGDIVSLSVKREGDCTGSKKEIDQAIVDDLIATYG